METSWLYCSLCCLFQLVNATTFIQLGTVKRGLVVANVVLSSLHLTVTVAVLATLAILNVDLVNVTSMGPGGFTVNLLVGSAPANLIMVGSSVTSAMMVITTSLSACVSHALQVASYCIYLSISEGYFYFYFQTTTVISKW